MQVFEFSSFNNNSRNLAQVLNTVNVGLWELELQGQKLTCSTGFYQLLGYEPGTIECTFANFTERLIYYKDKKRFLHSIHGQHALNAAPAPTEIRLLTQGGYRWFQSTVHHTVENYLIGSLVDIHNCKIAELKAAETADAQQLVRLAIWKLDLSANQFYLSDEAFDLIGLKERTVMGLEELISFYEPEHRPILTRAIDACRQYGRPFELDLKLRSLRNRVTWVTTKAVADIDDAGNCRAIHGTLQDIQQHKQEELELRSKLQLIDRQNKRLHNFAHIVTHNLRSYAGNLQFMVGLFRESELAEEREEAFSRIETIGNSLNKTIEHLNEIVMVEFEVNRQRKLIQFEPLLENVLNSLQGDIQITEAVIRHSFTECPEVYYQPAYLESIFVNLITNALKYRHPERAPLIRCESSLANGGICLIFEDNGLGIDLERYGEKLFGIYQTFHTNPDAQGIGLFMTRNQIEAMGGSINVESVINVGTKFTIQLV